MSHPKEEAGVETEVEEVEAGEEVEVQHKDLDSKELAEDQFTFRGNWQQRGSTRGRGQKYDKSPNVKKARVNTKTPNMDKDRCLKCNEFGHWAKDCPQNRMELSQRHFQELSTTTCTQWFLKYPWLQLQCHQMEFKSPCKDPTLQP